MDLSVGSAGAGSQLATSTPYSPPLATTSLTGVASFNPNRFQVSATGNVDLLAAYQATGDTVITVAGSGIGIVTSGRTDTLYNIGVTSFNGFTGAVQVTGSGAILHTVSGTTTTLGARLATTAVTGVASFNTNDFVASTTGHVSLTGTVARTNTTNNFTAIQAFPNGLSAQGATFAGMVSVADFLARTVGGDEGGEIKLGLAQTNTTLTGNAVTIDVYQNRLRIFESGGSARGYYMDLSAGSAGAGSQLATSTPYSPPLATTSVTGVASFNGTRFTVTNGAVDLAAAYQATGDTVITVAGSGIGIVTSGKTDTLYNIGVTSFNGFTGAVQVTGSGAILHTVSGTTTTLGARLATTSVTGVASFNNVRFTATTTGHIDLAAAYQATGQTVVSGGASQLVSTSGNTVTIDNRVASTSVTGVASFNATRFSVSNGAVDLAAAYQATGDTVITVAGSGIGIVTNGKTDTLYNIGVTSFNGLTGNVSFTGDGGSSLVLGNTVVTNRIATTAATGVASFNSTYFTVSSGAVSLASAYQATGDTVITVAGSGIGIATSGKTDTLYNIGVTSFNGLTGNVSLTGDGGSSLVLGNTVVTNRMATTAATGVASFNSTYFTVSSGAVSLAAAYQATGDTVITVAGSGIGIVTSGKTDTLYNIGVTSFNGFTGAVQVTGSGAILHTVSGTTTTFGARLSTTAVTGVASFSTNDFVVGTTGHVSLTGTVARTNTTNNFTAVQSFPNGISGAWLRVGTGATFGSVVDLTSSTAKIVGTNAAGYLRLESFGTLFSIQAQPAIILQDGDTDGGGNGTITINPSTGGGGGTVVIGNASSPSITLDGNTINSGRMTVIGGLSAQALTVVAGATFGARSSFTSGLTTQSLYVSQGATFNSTAAFAGNISAPNIVNSVNGQTGNIAIGLASSSLTGLASFNTPHFSVSATGHVSLGSAYQATGDTIIAGTNITISRAGNAVTVNSSGGAASAAGSDTQVQYNASGSLSADNGLVYTVSTETLRIGSAVRHLEISPGIDNNIQAFGSSNLRLTQQAGNPITIGDFDGTYGGNNTYISVDDTSSLIAMYAATVTMDSTLQVGFDARVLGGLSASSLFVSTGATFAGNISAKNIVNSVNGLTGAITLTSGSNITLTPSGNTITIASTASGGISRSISTITTSTSAGASASYDYVFIGATSGNINLTLPTAVSNTNRYSVKQSNAVGTLTLLTTSSQTIDGLTAFALNKQYQAVDLISDNANWHIL